MSLQPSYEHARHAKPPLGRLTFACVVAVCGALLVPSVAEAQRRGGGGARTGNMAQASISGANRASHQAASRSAASTAAARPSTGNVNAGNRVNTANVNTDKANAGNRVNTGNINTGNINTGDVNINRDVDVNVDHDGWGGWHDVDVDIDGGAGDWQIDVDVDHYHPIATAAAITTVAATTAAMTHAYYYSVPVGCPIVHTYPVPYYYCGGVYYDQRMQGDKVVYVVVTP